MDSGDTNTSYVLKTQLYTEKKKGAVAEKNQSTRIVTDLTSDLRGHNITCDNFFTFYNLSQILLKQKLTMLGTIRKNKPKLPPFSNKEVCSFAHLSATKKKEGIFVGPDIRKLLSDSHFESQIL